MKANKGHIFSMFICAPDALSGTWAFLPEIRRKYIFRKEIKTSRTLHVQNNGADDGIRTRNIQLGKLTLYR